MAEEKDVQTDAAVERDPIVEGSLNWPLTIAVLALVLSTGWALYDEFIGRQPWRTYQAAFAPAYGYHLRQVQAEQRAKEQEIEANDEYQQLKAEYEAVRDQVGPKRKKLGERLAQITLEMAAITKELKEARSYTAATIYQIEGAATEADKEKLRDDLATYHKGPFEVNLPDENGDSAARTYDYQQLRDTFAEMRDEKSELRRNLGQLVRLEATKKKAMNAYVDRYLQGPTSATIEAQITSLDKFKPDITSHQIYVDEVGLVDRCEVCHLAIRSSVDVASEDIQAAPGDISKTMANAFVSHPRIELADGDLLEVHRPDKFGCTPCHGGNGRALTSVEHAHGRYKHWLWPLYEQENVEAGCVQCHEGALHLDGAPTLNRGRYLFLRLGCWGCHVRDGYDAEAGELKNIDQDEQHIADGRRHLLKQLDAAYESEELDLDPDAIKQKLSQLDADWEQLRLRRSGLERARKKPGPSLADTSIKLKPAWLPTWLKDPRGFRPNTRMPHFDLPDDQVEAIAAFLWQAAQERPIGQHERGDAARGKEVFETRGCQACHGLAGVGGSYAADLSRVGEKINYDYMVEWIKDPPAWAVMPDLRLDDEEVRDVATYLDEQRTDAEYEPATSVTDTSLFDQGRELVEHYGCFGCHDIAGMSKLGKNGTDLTRQGAKPLEQLDFARLTHEAKVERWYDHKGFFERKLSEPRAFDEGKVKLDWREKLRMPDFGLKDKPDDRRALITFLLGSIDSQLPSFYYHNPTGWAKDIEEGWWVAKKYNCIGCHQMTPTQTPELWQLPLYDGEGREQAPPSLVGAGARLDADWVAKFLRNPALSDTKLHRNGARMYLDIRMPSYHLSEDEIGKLVRFFNALSKQPSPYPFEKLEPLNEDELADARAIFKAGRCLSCHVTSDDPRSFTSETKAPSYLVGAQRLKPQWLRNWLRDPDKIMPNTVMPAFFKEVDGLWQTLVLRKEKLRMPDADQIEIMVRYQKFFDEAEAEFLLQAEAAGR